MANPFKNLVGLKGVDTSAVSWVNELSGLTTELVDALTRNESDQATDVWNRIQAAALDKLESELYYTLTAFSTFNPVIASIVQPEPLSGAASAPVDHYKGLVLSVPASANTRVRIVGLVFMAEINSPVTTQVRVMNANRLTVLSQAEVTVNPGDNAILINLDYPLPLLTSPKLFVGINTSGLSLLPLSEPKWNSAGDSYYCKPATFLESSVLDASANYFYIDAEHQRTLTAVIPRFADQLRLPYLYLCGSLLMTEKLGSTRFNLFTNTNRDFTIEQEEKLMKDFKSGLKPIARLIEQHLQQKGSLTPASDTDSGYSMGSFV